MSLDHWMEKELQSHGAILVTMENEDQAEITDLLKTLDVEVKKVFVQKLSSLSATHLLGSGKVKEIQESGQSLSCFLLVVDHPLSPSQMRNLERDTGLQVWDREGIILEIFARHAKSLEAQTQVDLARCHYMKSRLKGAWTHFQKQQGGIGGRGMGETQIEVDRRRVRTRMTELKKRLESIERQTHQKGTHRQKESSLLPLAALVGYTNAGKTTWMSALTSWEESGQDRLFATLDSKTKPLYPKTRPEILLSDTVGFIRKLPQNLMASFRSTLGELRKAHLLIHVIDASHWEIHQQIAVVNEVLENLGVDDLPRILLFNKIDLCPDLSALKQLYPQGSYFSALNPSDVKTFYKHLVEYFLKDWQRIQIKLPLAEEELGNLARRVACLEEESYQEPHYWEATLRIPPHLQERFRPYIQEETKTP